MVLRCSFFSQRSFKYPNMPTFSINALQSIYRNEKNNFFQKIMNRFIPKKHRGQNYAFLVNIWNYDKLLPQHCSFHKKVLQWWLMSSYFPSLINLTSARELRNDTNTQKDLNPDPNILATPFWIKLQSFKNAIKK